MTMGNPTDALFGVCHVVAKIPALAIAFCAVGVGVASPDIAQFAASSFGADSQHACHIDTKTVVAIDLKQYPRYVALGDCLKQISPITLSEIQKRCAALNKEDKFCIVQGFVSSSKR